MRRWECPRCGTGGLAPERPRRDDVRRYCLDCSKATGRLVERTCPALDRARVARRGKAAAKRATDRDRERAAEVARRTAGPFDLEAEAFRFWRLDAVRSLPGWRRTLPSITWRRSASKVRTSGHCWYGPPPTVVVTIGSDPYLAVEVVLHELIHAALPHVGHSERFYRSMHRACREAFPDGDFGPVDDLLALPRAWQRDDFLARRIPR